MVWNTTLLWSVPPYTGCGWQTSAACVAFSAPAFSSASRFPAGPLRNSERMLEPDEITHPDYTILRSVSFASDLQVRFRAQMTTRPNQAVTIFADQLLMNAPKRSSAFENLSPAAAKPKRKCAGSSKQS